MLSTDRFDRGLQKLYAIDGNAGQAVIDALTGTSKDVGRYIIEFAFGDIYSRKALSLEQREMITIVCLLTQGDTAAQLYVHINGALNVGLSEADVVETFIQCIPYVGFPKVLNALKIAQNVFDERSQADQSE